MPGGFGDERLGSANDPPGELRLWLIALMLVGAFGVFVLRLFQLQILEGADLASRSQRNSVRTLRLEAPRGDIVDREGRVLATSRPAFRVQVIPNDVHAARATYRVLGELLDRDAGDLQQLVGEPRGRRRFQPVVIEGDLSYESRARVETHRYALPGVVTDMTPRRYYVEHERAAHLLGTIGEIDPRELATEAFADYQAGEVIGKFGLEAGLEPHLRGHAGGRNVVVDVAGQEIEVIDEVEPVPGGRLVLTLDLDLQRAAEEAFAPDPSSDPIDPDDPDAARPPPPMGALVAIDPRNGDILAMVSKPDYDPNSFAGGIDSETWAALTGDEWKPLRNRALSGQYPPGSTYKPIVAVAGLAEKKIDPHKTVFCPGYYRLGRRIYRCWKRGGHGEVDLVAALRDSCDVYFYQLGVELGIDTIADYARRFGLGQLTGIMLQGERAGLVPTKAWKERARNEPWIKGETVSASIGQGYNLVTPLQLAVAFGALGNGGRHFPPRIVQRLETWDGRLVHAQPPGEPIDAGIDPAVLAEVRAGLVAVVEGTPGTPATGASPGTPRVHGTGARARVPDVVVAGKTGTSQVVRLDLVKDLEDDEIPVRYRDHALFAAFAPAEAPEIAVAVVVEHAGRGGGAAAAPIAQKVLARYFEKKREREAPEEVVAWADGADGAGERPGAEGGR
jgi:penicillin-binding protein 2